MKKSIFLAIVFALFGFVTAFAVPACPEPATVTQPDGSALTIRLVGDEFMHFTTTLDGYTVVKRSDGFYVYASLVDDALVPTSVVARDVNQRTVSDRKFLYGVKKNIHPDAKAARLKHSLLNNRVKKAGSAQPKLYDYKKFHGLIILVNFNDRKFSRADSHAVFDSIVCARNFKGFKDVVTDTLIPYTGSVCDYFHDNSAGKFDPKFDVVGPVDVDYSCTYPHAGDSIEPVVKAAVTAADPLVNYADYDIDKNGSVDMIFFIFAGYGANFSDNNRAYVWPHAANFNQFDSNITLDGVNFGRYACSTEIFGHESGSHHIDGISVICHEFTHVLGTMDLYDTDYEGSGGESITPSLWSLMALGGYLDNGFTPAGYGLYERYTAGFTTPQLISTAGSYSLDPINISNTGYRINSPQDNVYFLLENRQQTGWDKFLPGHGLLVFRVDSTDVSVWEGNTVNVNPAYNYYELLRADCQYYSDGYFRDSSYDPFPGTGNVTQLNNATTPNLRTHSGLDCPLVLSGITESNGVITFSVDNAPSAVAAVKASSSSLSALRSGNVITVTTSDSAQPVSLYRADGILLNRANVVGSASFTLPSHGLFIVNQGNASQKIMY
ncbi:MAG: M6 family metalloprotease domain-containing protein [Muribaculaceae bacterium]|jgi:immune inhibitor A|nr:M6 family metalloprotease domain-containing protein [Muribaculaceae bacterium]